MCNCRKTGLIFRTCVEGCGQRFAFAGCNAALRTTYANNTFIVVDQTEQLVLFFGLWYPSGDKVVFQHADPAAFGRKVQVLVLHIFKGELFITLFTGGVSTATVYRHHHIAVFTILDGLSQIMIRLDDFAAGTGVGYYIINPDIIFASAEGITFLNLQTVVFQFQADIQFSLAISQSEFILSDAIYRFGSAFFIRAVT